MNAWFADTSWFLAIANPRDLYHSKAVELSRQRQTRLITTAWVITELADGLSQPPPLRRTFVEILRSIENDPTATLIPADDRLFREGLTLYSNRTDKEWSLTDCTSFVAMKRMGVVEALTADHHFEQAGYVALFK